MSQDKDKLKKILAPVISQVRDDFDRWLIEPGTPDTLAKAMRYCVDGGKRLRPALVMFSAQAVGGDTGAELVRRCATAVEMVHVYSLVHDDLPAMDDDELRRGRPTAHIKFGEAMAILTGDALLTRAFGALAESGEPLAGKLVAELSSAAGAIGMVGGQVADMALCDVAAGYEGLEYIHRRKTGALITAAARMGAIAAGADENKLGAITAYARALGLAFQVCDDILDATGNAVELGKTPGKDVEAGKRTVVTELGLEKARELNASLTAQARQALAPLGEKGNVLADLVAMLAERTN